ELVAGLEGRIWERTVDREEAESLRERYDVLSARLVAGHRQMRVYAEHPPAGFEGSAAGLEDVYFHAIQQSGRIAPAEAA
ncbi:MAG: ABC transporter ATP-binding protein, partial [Myxococcota bacterium]